ncbi:MAG TPA: SIMPL domain-containing protein [Terriglobales bacterium]|nr:SIMPL domain-containing protein [Terriglobales bacterium]
MNRTNKTIAVTVDETLTVDAEAARLKFAVLNYAATSDEAYNENVRISARVLGALQSAAVPVADIETSSIKLALVPEDERPAGARTAVRYQARQGWTVKVLAPEAQAVLEGAVQAGANEIDEIEWGVTDPAGLEAEANGKALAKARGLAEKMARELGAKLGELVYASNTEEDRFVQQFWLRRDRAYAFASKVALRLFPEKVSRKATVRAVFAIE